ncbi:hypothetical protein RCL1_008727 [Eukaryota sp. TZLM3-RCL]
MASFAKFVTPMTNFQSSLEVLSSSLTEFMNVPMETREKDLSPTDVLNMKLSILDILVHLLYAQVRVQGLDHDNHPVMKEICRVKDAKKKVKAFLDALNSNEPPLKKPHLDVEDQ